MLTRKSPTKGYAQVGVMSGCLCLCLGRYGCCEVGVYGEAENVAEGYVLLLGFLPQHALRGLVYGHVQDLCLRHASNLTRTVKFCQVNSQCF